MSEPQSDATKRFLWPADYYSSPSPAAVLPRGVTFGCAGASVLVLLIVFIGGIFLSGGGLVQVVDLTLGVSIGEMRGMFGPDVTPARRKTLEAEIETMREHLRGQRVGLGAMQPFMNGLRSAVEDERVTATEAAQLEESARKINATAKR